jgi:chromosome partitioning protein
VFALKGMAQFENTIAKVQKAFRVDYLTISGVVCTLYDFTNVARDTMEMLRKHFGDIVFQTFIPKNVKLEEAHSRSQSIFEYAPTSKGAESYQQLVQEVIARG